MVSKFILTFEGQMSWAKIHKQIYILDGYSSQNYITDTQKQVHTYTNEEKFSGFKFDMHPVCLTLARQLTTIGIFYADQL